MFLSFTLSAWRTHEDHPHTHTQLHTATHRVFQCFTQSAPRGERFVQQQLSEEVNWDCFKKCSRSFGCDASPRRLVMAPLPFYGWRAPPPLGQWNIRHVGVPGGVEGEERAERWDSCSSGSGSCRARKTGFFFFFFFQSMQGWRGWSEWMSGSVFVGRWQKEFSGVLFSFYSSGDEINDLGMNRQQTLSCLLVF